MPIFIKSQTHNKMQKFKVISLSVGGKNKVHKLGDEVTENDFPGTTADLVAGGFLEPIKQEVEQLTITDPVEPEATKQENEPQSDDAEMEVDAEADQPEPETDSQDPIDAVKQMIEGQNAKAFKKPEVVEMLTKCGIPFDPTSVKNKLFKLLVDSLNG